MVTCGRALAVHGVATGVPHEGNGEPVRAEACSSKDPGPVAARDQASAVAGNILGDGMAHEGPASRPVLVLRMCDRLKPDEHILIMPNISCADVSCRCQPHSVSAPLSIRLALEPLGSCPAGVVNGNSQRMLSNMRDGTI